MAPSFTLPTSFHASVPGLAFSATTHAAVTSPTCPSPATGLEAPGAISLDSPPLAVGAARSLRAVRVLVSEPATTAQPTRITEATTNRRRQRGLGGDVRRRCLGW